MIGCDRTGEKGEDDKERKEKAWVGVCVCERERVGGEVDRQ